jgi:hypothetical protein
MISPSGSRLRLSTFICGLLRFQKIVTHVLEERLSSEEHTCSCEEDEREPEIDFDVASVEQLVNRMIACNRRTYAFFCDEIPGYRELPSRLFDSVNPGS